MQNMAKILIPFSLLLVGCTNHGGIALPDGFTMGPGTAGSYTCEGIMPSAHQIYCDTGEHPNLCDC